MAEYYLEQVRDSDVCVLRIECNPPTSIPFWKKMGFTLFPSSNEFQSDAYMVLEKKFPLPNDLPSARVSIAFYPERRLWEQTVGPVIKFSPKAAQISKSEILLEDRVICFDPKGELGHDPVVGIVVNEEQMHLDKVKCKEFGVQCDQWGTY